MEELKAFGMIISVGGGGVLTLYFVLKILKLFKNGEPAKMGLPLAQFIERGITVGIQIAENSVKETMLIEQLSIVVVENSKKLDGLLNHVTGLTGNQEVIMERLESVKELIRNGQNR